MLLSVNDRRSSVFDCNGIHCVYRFLSKFFECIIAVLILLSIWYAMKESALFSLSFVTNFSEKHDLILNQILKKGKFSN